MVVFEPESALEALKSAGFAVSLTEVVCLNTPNEPGALAKALNILSSEGVFIEYLYAYSMDKNSAIIVIKPEEIQKCIKVLQGHKLELVSASDLYKL